MRWDVIDQVDNNSFDYFEKTLITDNGYREYDLRWLVGEEINPNGFFVLGRAYGTMMRRELDENRVVVGHDFRSYSQDLSRSLVLGLLTTGVHVIDIGLALSPMVYFAQHHFGCKAGLEVTASHNPNGWTGLKIADGLSSTLGPDGVKQFKSIVKAADFESGSGTYESFDDIEEFYKKDLLKAGTLENNNLRVVVATGNGTAGRFAPSILRDLGCSVIEVDCTADWEFKKGNPNPEALSFLEGIRVATLENKADIGIGIDGDGDRIGVIDEKGREIFSDKVGLILARYICPTYPNRHVVIDIKCTGLFLDDDILTETETEVVLWKTGHSYIKSMVAEKNAIAGFERSGHCFFNEPIGHAYDDAIAASIQLLKMLDASGKTLSEIVDEMPKTWMSPTLSPHCPDDLKYDVVERVMQEYQCDYEAGTLIGGKRIKEVITTNGVRFVLEDNSFGLIRASSNAPCLAMVAESRDSEQDSWEIMRSMQDRLAQYEEVGEYDQEMPVPATSG
jgi:phosphomannomutase/phosphoglucomutase